MSEVQVNKIQPEGESLLLLTQQLDALYDEINRRAFLRFEARGCLHGYDREDWIEAERSLIFAPPAELVEEDNGLELRLAVPGFDPNQIRLNVLPHMIIVDGDFAPAAEQGEGKVCFSEFSNRKLLRRVDLPHEVRTYTAKATLKDGILQVKVKTKAAQDTEQSQSAAAGT